MFVTYDGGSTTGCRCHTWHSPHNNNNNNNNGGALHHYIRGALRQYGDYRNEYKHYFIYIKNFTVFYFNSLKKKIKIFKRKNKNFILNFFENRVDFILFRSKFGLTIIPTISKAVTIGCSLPTTQRAVDRISNCCTACSPCRMPAPRPSWGWWNTRDPIVVHRITLFKSHPVDVSDWDGKALGFGGDVMPGNHRGRLCGGAGPRRPHPGERESPSVGEPRRGGVGPVHSRGPRH